ncbi:Hypothetical predicted protein, partial [Scomber scombrus]
MAAAQLSPFVYNNPPDSPTPSSSVNVDVRVILPVRLSCSLASVFSLYHSQNPNRSQIPAHITPHLHSSIPESLPDLSRGACFWPVTQGAKQLLKGAADTGHPLPITLDSNRPPTLGEFTGRINNLLDVF